MPEVAERELTFAQAIREALTEEMRREPTVCIMGEDVAEAGTPFKVLSGLVEEFGTDRVLDTPISEAGFTGLAVGAGEVVGMRIRRVVPAVEQGLAQRVGSVGGRQGLHGLGPCIVDLARN